MDPKIKSSTGNAKLVKQGHTTSGKFGTAINKKASHSAKEISPKGGK